MDKKYSAIIFDFDDTLVKTFNHVLDFIYPLIAKEHDIIFKGKEIALAKWGSDLDTFFSSVFEGYFESSKLLSRMTEIQRESPPPPFEETLNLLSTLIANNVYIAIYTSGLKTITENTIINSLKMRPSDFSLIFCTPEYSVKKPTNLVINEIKRTYQELKKEEINTEQMLFVGDGLGDFITAKEAGADFIAVTSGVHKANDFMELGLAEDLIYGDINKAKNDILYSL
jgi:phosphoglycolate phosphatase-like HAD superfamily hydrolase